jgi:hypothetical protein
MKKTFKNHMTFKEIIGIIIGLISIMILQPGCSNQSSIEKLLKQTANNINKSCPMIVDSETQLDNIVVMPDNVFQYNYTLVNMEKETIDIEDIKNYVEPILINGIKTMPELKMFRDNNVTMAYYYKDKNGLFLTRIEISPEKYKN